MTRVFENTRWMLIALFFVASSATWAYQYFYIWPMQKCERAGAWWDWRDRQCLIPIPIWRLTGRGEPLKAPGKP